jgi:hypothetical protein
MLALPGVAGAAAPDHRLPNDSEFVLHINMPSLLEAGVVKKYFLEAIKGGLTMSPQVQNVLQKTGIDPLKDIHGITVAGSGMQVNPAAIKPGRVPDFQGEIVILVSGKFDPAKCEKCMEEDGKKDIVSTTQHGDIKVFEVKGPESKEPGFVAFVDSKTVAISNKSSRVKDCIDRCQGKGAGKLNENFAKLHNKVDGQKSIWSAALVPAAGREKVEGVTLTLHLRDDLATEVLIFAQNMQASDEILKALEFGKLMAAGFGAKDKEWGPLLNEVMNGVKTSKDGNVVKIVIDIGAGTIDKAMKKAQGGL